MGYQTVFKRNEAEYVEKRSRFIATLCHCETEDEANAFVKEMKSKYWDARHNVYAYSVEGGRMCRFSDDGEPHGTAGKPMLDCIQGSGITNIAVVVTRYFGGILLGTGGLVRAYSKATQDVLSSAEVYIMLKGVLCEIVCEYSDLTLLQNLITANEGEIKDTQYTDKITITFVLKEEFYESFKEKLRESFCARLEIEEKENILIPFLKK
ncbi:MAG: YigZ family protein [Clostridia bacterium]|nr:YigZ family protein [Clostridia bacterium]